MGKITVLLFYIFDAELLVYAVTNIVPYETGRLIQVDLLHSSSSSQRWRWSGG